MRNGISGSRRRGIVMGLSAAIVLLVSPALAQEDLEKPPPIPPAETEDVPIPPKVQDEQIEPVVTIRETEERLVEEYSRNGQVYMVKVTPRGGVPYYYIDTDGDGRLEIDLDEQALKPVQPVHWKVKEWD